MYEEALQAIFVLQLERYSHVQAHHNPENQGKLRWECLEFWPIQVISWLCVLSLHYLKFIFSIHWF